MVKIAIVHDQLQEFGGAERVLVSLKKIFPEADVYTSFYNSKTLGIHADKFKNWNIITSWADKIPGLKKLYSPLRFITPKIWESFNLSSYGLVISSSGAYMCKGVITKPKTVHICYLHHPPRYLYNYETAIEWQKYPIIKLYGNLINHDLRIWDYFSSQRPNFFIANSEETKRRIKKFYHRDATVIYPPVSIPKQANEPTHSTSSGQASKPGNQLTSQPGNYYITTSRLARAKHIEILIQAANKMKFHLKIIGAGRDEKNLRFIAGPTIEFLGSVSDSQFKTIYQNANAFLFSSVDEEFGIAVVEAMGFGLPVIAYNSGGVPEIVKDEYNGFLFDQLKPDALNGKIKLLENLPNDKYIEMKKNARLTAEKFTENVFCTKIKDFVKKQYAGTS